VIEVRELSLGYRQRDGGVVRVVHEVSLELRAGSVVGLVGESGSGKSTLGLHMLGWRPRGAVHLGGTVRFGGIDLLRTGRGELQRLWGSRLAYVPQEVSVALNPSRRVGPQLEEPLLIHRRLSRRERRERVLSLLHEVRVDADARTLARYPFEFSGGQQQRMALVLAMMCEPEVLVLDEPTTGIDATSRLDVLEALQTLLARGRTAALYISHDLAETASLADRLVVMYAGEVVEEGPTDAIYGRPRHPYSAALREAVPAVTDAHHVRGIPGTPPGRTLVDRCGFADRCPYALPKCIEGAIALEPVGPDHVARCCRVAEILPAADAEREPIVRREAPPGTLLAIRDLTCAYGPDATAVAAVSLDVAESETLGIVGESGSGKSTLLLAIAGLHRPREGAVKLHGEPLAPAARERTRVQQRDIQLVFQNPGRSLNPRHSVARILDAPLRLYQPGLGSSARRNAAVAALESVRLTPRFLGRMPHELSGGEKQRVALARAFAASPRLLLCDEVVSALDVSVQAAIMELIRSYCERERLAVVFVTHDLAVARMMCDRIAVFRDGSLCELGATDRIFEAPTHPYTQELLASLPETAAAATRS